MAQCPKCGTKIDDSGFMVLCPGCKTTLFLDSDGNLTDPSKDVPEEAHSSGVASDPSPSDAFPSAFADPPSHSPGPTSMSPLAGHEQDPMAGIQPMQGFDGSADPFSNPVDPTQSPNFPSAPEEAGSFFPTDSPSASSTGFDGVGVREETGFPPMPSRQDFGPPDDLLGINSYANSEISQAKDGMLVFRILISGIDSKEVRDSIREAMEDSRFGWNTGELMAQITKGRLRIDSVSPVKASILINRIKSLPVRIRWEQYAITQMEGP